jgi:hypothetical protein
MSEKDEEIAALTLSCVRELLSKRVRHPFGILSDTTTPHTLQLARIHTTHSIPLRMLGLLRPARIPPSRLPLDGSSLMICKKKMAMGECGVQSCTQEYGTMVGMQVGLVL